MAGDQRGCLCGVQVRGMRDIVQKPKTRTVTNPRTLEIRLTHDPVPGPLLISV